MYSSEVKAEGHLKIVCEYPRYVTTLNMFKILLTQDAQNRQYRKTILSVLAAAKWLLGKGYCGIFTKY